MSETALYQYLVAVYNELDKRSEMSERGEKLFVGNLTDVFKDSGASMTYYTPVRSLLLSPDLDPCIEIYQRGNSSQPSIIRLHHPPPQEWEEISSKALTAPRQAATMVSELEPRVQRLEAWRESMGEVNLSEALRNMESRLSRLESKREGNG